MSETKFTPGPWKFNTNHDWTIRSEAHSGSLMGNATSYPWVPENKADWHLIAAAPELYRLLDEALSYTSCESWSPSLTDEIKAALSKARGEG